MTALPDLGRRIDRALENGRGLKLSADEARLFWQECGAIIGEHVEHDDNPFDFPSSSQRECSDCAPWCYFIQVGEYGPVKIGRAKNAEQRRTELQTAHAETLHIRAKTKDYTEADCHRHYAREHVRGEWHRPSPRLLAFIDSLVRG